MKEGYFLFILSWIRRSGSPMPQNNFNKRLHPKLGRFFFASEYFCGNFLRGAARNVKIQDTLEYRLGGPGIMVVHEPTSLPNIG
jgi:hypothetical protein